MKTKVSLFLEQSKPILRTLIKDLQNDFEYVSILGSDTIGSSYLVTRNSSKVSDTSWQERGFVLRVFNGVNYSEYSFNELNDMEAIKQKIYEIARKDIALFKEQKINLFDYPLLVEDELKMEYHSDVKIDPFLVSSEEKINKLSALMKEGMSRCEHLVDFNTTFEEVKISKIFISTKKELSQSILYSILGLVPFARYNNQMKYAHTSINGLMGMEVFDQADAAVDKVIDEIKSVLDATRLEEPGMYDIICDPAVSGLIAHEAFGHGVEMDMFVKQRAKGQEYIGKQIASEKVNMRDGAQSMQHIGTYLFDDEGTLGSDTLVIDHAILKSGISDVLSALKLGTSPTGNGKRQSFERKAYARMTNTYFEAGNETLEDMIQSIDHGYLLENYYSGMEDPKNWGIQCMIAKGKEIKNGKLTGKVISPVLLTGYVPDLLQSISMVSNDKVELSGSGACGKGYKEFVKTTTGGTYIKAIGRLS